MLTFAGVDEEGLFAAVAEAAFGGGGFAFREEPEGDGYLRAVEELAGEGDHAINEVGLDEGAADVSFAGLVGGHAAIGEVHHGEAAGGGVALLAVDADVAELAAVGFDEFVHAHLLPFGFGLGGNHSVFFA